MVDFGRSDGAVQALSINGEVVERVQSYKYLGTVIDKDLNFNDNTTAVYKKCQPRLFCLQKLRSLNVKQEILCSFYRCFIESILTFGFLSWYGGLSVSNKNVLERVVKVSSKVIGVRQTGLNELYEKRVKVKGEGIARDNSHVLAQYYDTLPSGKRFRTLKMRKNRYMSSFVCKPISVINRHCKR